MFDEVVQQYGSDSDGQTLKSQLGILQSHFTRREESVRLFHVVEYLTSLGESCCMILSEVKKLVSLILVLPATNARSKRSFSALKRAKIYLRNSMTQ